MRVRWDFLFECTGGRFDRIYKYAATISKKHAEEFGLPSQEFDALIAIEPDEESNNLVAEQTGKLKIVLPGNSRQTKKLALWLSHYVVQKINVHQGEMRVIYGLIAGEHLPDTFEEMEQLGDTPFFAEV